MRGKEPSIDTETLAHEGHELRCLVYEQGRRRYQLADLSIISDILEEPGALVWLDVVAPRAESLSIIQEEFKLHPLAIEDAVKAHQRPKIESYGGYWFLVVHGVTLENGMTIHEMAIFAGKNFVVTVRAEPAYPLDEIERRWHAAGKDGARRSGVLVYTILDTIVDGYSVATEAYEEEVELFEAALLTSRDASSDVLRSIFAKKKELQVFRRSVLPVRDVLMPIVRGDIDFLSAEDMPYYRDIDDHAVRSINRIDATHDLMSNALEIHLSISANRQNDTIKQLTIIATIFLPLSYLTGFFGQNFGFLVDMIKDPRAFFVLGIGGELAAVLALLWYFLYKRLL